MYPLLSRSSITLEYVFSNLSIFLPNKSTLNNSSLLFTKSFKRLCKSPLLFFRVFSSSTAVFLNALTSSNTYSLKRPSRVYSYTLSYKLSMSAFEILTIFSIDTIRASLIGLVDPVILLLLLVIADCISLSSSISLLSFT